MDAPFSAFRWDHLEHEPLTHIIGPGSTEPPPKGTVVLPSPVCRSAQNSKIAERSSPKGPRTHLRQTPCSCSSRQAGLAALSPSLSLSRKHSTFREVIMASSAIPKANGASKRVANGAANGHSNGAPKAEEEHPKEHDFFWTYTEEPHRTRRMAIIKAHPEVC